MQVVRVHNIIAREPSPRSVSCDFHGDKAVRSPGLESTRALPHGGLKVEPELGRQRTGRHIVRPAEGGKKVIQRQFVGQIDGGKRKAPFVMVAFEQIVVTHRSIKQVTRRNTLRIVIVVFRP